MSTRECLTAALNGETPERTPFSAYEQFFYDYKNEPPQWDNRQCPDLRKLLDMGLGLTLHVLTIHYDMQGVEVEVKQLEKDGQSHRIERWITPVGAVEKLHVDDWQTEFFIKQPSDYKVLQWVVEHTEILPRYDEFIERDSAIGEHGLGLVYANRTPAMVIAVDWGGAERFCMDVGMEVEEFFDLYTSMRRLFVEETKMVAKGPGRFVKWNENMTASLLGPRRYSDLLLSVYEECVPILEQAGKRVMVHYDGALSPVKDMIAGAPFHILQSLTEAPEGDMTYAECRDAWPDKAFYANINVDLYNLPVDQLQDAVIAKRERAGKKGLVFEISEELPTNWRTAIPAVLKAIEELN